MTKNFSKNNKGFTLIEMLVSLALFTIVLTITIGSIFTVIDANRKSQTLNIVMNNLNFAVESMTRDLKTADPSRLTATGSYDILTLYDNNDRRVIYQKDGNNVEKIKDSLYSDVFPEEVVVEDFYVNVLGSAGQPRVFIYIKGYVEITQKTRSDFVIQTTVSPRKLNIN